MKNKKLKIELVPGYLIVLLFCLFIFIMIGWIVLASLSTTPEIFKGQMLKFKTGLHFENYLNALISNNIGICFINSLLYTVLACSLIIAIAAPASYALAKFKFRGNKYIQLLIMIGMGLPQVMIIMPLFSIFSKFNLNGSRFVLILLYLGIILPFTVFFMINFFKKIPNDYAEAAKIDGCSQIQTFWKIMMPLTQSGLVTVTVFNIITIWNEYFISLIFANDSNIRPVAIGLMNMINSMKYTGDWAGMFAAVVIVFLPTFIMYIFLSDRIVAGITAGGVKG